MNKIFPYIVASLLFLGAVSCNSKKNIEANIKNIPAQKVILQEIKGSDFILIDSTTVEKNKPFSLSAPLGQEKMYRLFFQQEKYIMLALEGGDQLNIEADWNQLDNYEVSGSKKSAIIKELVDGTRKNILDIRTFKTIFDTLQAKGESEKLKEAQKDYQIHNVRFMDYLKQFADTTTSAVAAVMAVNIINPKIEAPFVSQFYQTIDQRFPKNDLVALYKERFTSSPGLTTQSVDTKKGNLAADFVGQTPDGKSIRLQDYRGKYVLIDFWASWCGPCRGENPNVVKAYNQFKSKNFDILGISLDTDKDNWTKAVTKDKLAWNHISELKGWDCSIASKYNVRSIPANFLIDPEGFIIAQNLRGEQLIARLNELIK